MSRTAPDPVFAAAARAEVEQRVRATAPDGARPDRRPWVMELGAIAGVAVLVAGIAVGVTHLRPHLDEGSAPAGAVTRSAAPTTEPPTSPVAPPTSEAPTSPPPSTTPPPTPPTEPPTAPSVRTTAPPTAATTTPPPATATTLVGPTGAERRTSAEIRTWALSIGSSEIWAEQAVLDTTCMAEHGFLHDPELGYREGIGAERTGMTDAQYAAYRIAEYGPQTDAPYDWRTAGCHGRSVHLTGQDDAH